MRAGSKAWLALGIGVVVYEFASREGELLSEAVDRYLEEYPVVTTAAIVLTAMHLLNVLPERVDPWVMGLRFVKGGSRFQATLNMRLTRKGLSVVPIVFSKRQRRPQMAIHE